MAKDFNGSTSKIETALTSHASQRTYFVWTYREGNGGSGFGRVFDKRTSSGQVELLFWDSPNSEYAYGVNWDSPAQWQIETAPAANEWHNILVTYDSGDSGNAPSAWVDGSSSSITEAAAPSGSLATNSDPYVIGNRGNQQRTFDGAIAEFAIWDRILTSGEIHALGVEGFSPLFFLDGLVMYRPMIRDATDRVIGAGTETDTSVVPHPRIIYPTSGFVVPSPTVAAVANTRRYTLSTMGVG